MPYIGNTVQTQGFTPQIDYFSGNGSTVTFTLSRPVVSVAQMIVAIDNVIQNPSSAYTVSGSSITFTSAPLSGTNNIWVEYTSLITTYAALSQSPSVVGDITASGGYLAVGNFGASFVDGTIVDYVTGNGRITAGPADGITLYNGGTSARTALAAWDASGNLTNTGAGSFQGVTVGKGGGAVSTNTAVGNSALTGSGDENTAVGYAALTSNTTGNAQVAFGKGALQSNTTGAENSAFGRTSMVVNTTGSQNAAFGRGTLQNNTTGSYNSASGAFALFSNTTASQNTAVGWQAGYLNTTGQYSAFFGPQAGYSATGSNNTFIGGKSSLGYGCGELMTTGSRNVIIGGYSGNQNTIDFRTSSDRIVISDGGGLPKMYHDGGATWSLLGNASATPGNNFNVDNLEIYGYPDNTFKCGYPSYRWTVVYAVSGTINTSDANQKQQIRSLDAKEKAVATRIKGLIKAFKWNDSVAEKGDGARIHVGVIAQDVQAAFVAEGLDPSRYGMFCSDSWYAVDGKAGKPANPYTAETEGAVEVTQLGIRYDQLLSFVISAL